MNYVVFFFYGSAFLLLAFAWVAIVGALIVRVVYPSLIMLVKFGQMIIETELPRRLLGLGLGLFKIAFHLAWDSTGRLMTTAGRGVRTQFQLARDRVFTPSHEELLEEYYRRLPFKHDPYDMLLHDISYNINKKILILETIWAICLDALREVFGNSFGPR